MWRNWSWSVHATLPHPYPQVRGVPGSSVSPREFRPFWIQIEADGSLAVGTGVEPSEASLSYRWRDEEEPIRDVKFVGLSCWDRHVCYR